ncbi:glycosyltransferase family 50 protein [Amanita muscaria Koide BX008]|uniref:GPI mannosyltransferase 1 n=1 Tax=Amanita muscaria (strain Koide BX008) TaxID=946122 RepID=A0A0C2XLP4_AMAMK|nr:glycosyltransferase family 50 protein [Amanita muscaria Koide BX008]
MTLVTFRNVLLVSILLRVILILYSEWHDARSLVKYTDVDYRVFSDAARFLLYPSEVNSAQGPVKGILGFNFTLGDPYTRETYRYTPLLALILTPNEWLHPSFGKLLFAACDIINGIIIYGLLLRESSPQSKDRTKVLTETKDTLLPELVAESMRRDRLATIYAATYLLNPLVFSISTRGSSESVLSLFVLLTLDSALRGRWNLAAVWLGVSTHWKIYPVIYGVSCLGVISNTANRGSLVETGGVFGYFGSLVNRRTVRFTALSGGTFLALGAVCYALWGYPFLYESYLYHLHRLDHRHNFSPYFYLTYLTYPALNITSSTAAPLVPWTSRLIRSPLASFVPQMALALGTGLLFGRRKEELVFTWFVQTVLFVLFNKVCTSQYFLWYLLFLPLLIPQLQSMSKNRVLLYIAVWVGTQALWLAEAYKLEFLGENVFFSLWIRSLVYVAGNCWVLAGIMNSYE